MHLFLRARAVINFLMQAASTLTITNGEQGALPKFSASWNLSLLKRCFALSNLVDKKLGNIIRPYRGLTISSSLQPIMPCLYNMPFAAKLLHLQYLHGSQWVDAKRDLKISKALFSSK